MASLNPSNHSEEPSSQGNGFDSEKNVVPFEKASDPFTGTPLPKLSGLRSAGDAELRGGIDSEANRISAFEITGRMEQDGFPELQRHWRKFLQGRISVGELNDQEIDASRERHMEPLFGRPKLGLAVSAAIGAGASYLVGGATVTGLEGTLATGFNILQSFNMALLTAYSLTYLQRTVVHSMERIMGQDVAFMLSKPDFRQWFESTEACGEVDRRLRELGVNEQWDNPRYRARYSMVDGEPERVTGSDHELLQEILQKYLGYMDPERRRHVPGDFSPNLTGGKKAISGFFRSNRADVERNKTGELAREKQVELLKHLQPHVEPGTRAEEYLHRQIRYFQGEEAVPQSVTEGGIWARDPWFDLTHQEEFFSSASLRGVKLIGRGVKGRLGTFGYLRNRSISAFDFSDSGGRKVRARIAAAITKDWEGQPLPVLFVDGVEGSNSIHPKIIKQAIEDLALATGFKLVAYSKVALNQVPKRFVKFLQTTGAALEQIDIEYVDARKREYLDAYGAPVEPMDYHRPKGRVMAYVVEIGDQRLDRKKQAPRLYERAKGWLRANSLNILVGEAIVFGSVAIGTTVPEALPAYFGVLGSGVIVNSLFQRRSLRKTSRAGKDSS